MRVLWVSDSPYAPTGLGNVTAAVCSGLAARGHDVHILGWETKRHTDWQGCFVYPSYGHKGRDSIYSLLAQVRPDVVVALGNLWWFPYFASPRTCRYMEVRNTPWLFYFPVDGDLGDETLPRKWIEILRAVQFPVTMSRYGQRVTKKCGIVSDYIPHGVDTRVFCPPVDREVAKARFGYEGKFVILSDSRNQPRKLLPRLIEIFARFARDCPNSLLHLRTDPEDPFFQRGLYSYDVRADIRYFGIESKVHFTPLPADRHCGLPLVELATYYQAADVHILASGGEGFGLPTLQAAAAGAVPMACAYSASWELTMGHGEPLVVEGWARTEVGIRRAVISVEQTVETLRRYYGNTELLRSRSKQGRVFAEQYQWDHIISDWDELLRSIPTRQQTYNIRPRPNCPQKHAADSIDQNSELLSRAASFNREYSRTEIRIPTTPEHCRVANVCVPRRMGSTILAVSDIPLFIQLARLFPALYGWVPGNVPSDGRRLEGALNPIELHQPEDIRYRLAQSVLLLNVGSQFSQTTLIDAAMLGVLSVGAGDREAQVALWPDLTTSSSLRAIDLTRQLLTNTALYQRLAKRARSACLQLYRPDEEDIARWLRKLHGVLIRSHGAEGPDAREEVPACNHST
jgi:glycosyltransferase involved in cell wall biosynthesis